MTREKRRHKRVQVNVPVIINRSIKARVVDLSESGVFVETVSPMEKDSALVIQFVDGDAKMLYGAIVRQSTIRKGSFYGFGAELRSLTPDHKEFVRTLIETGIKIESENRAPVILLVDGDETSRVIYGKVINKGGYYVITRDTFSDILAVFDHYKPVTVVVDYTDDTIRAVKSIRERDSKVPIVILSRLPHVPMEQLEGLDVQLCPKYTMPPTKFVTEVLHRRLHK
jgi:hypothetical protein